MIKKIPFQILVLLLLIPSFANAGTDITYTNPQVSLIRNTGANIDPAITDNHYFRKHATVASLVCQHLWYTYVSYTSGYPTGSSVPQTQNFGTTSDLWYSGGSTASVITALTCNIPDLEWCTYSTATNYNDEATIDNWSCTFDYNYNQNTNYWSGATIIQNEIDVPAPIVESWLTEPLFNKLFVFQTLVFVNGAWLVIIFFVFILRLIELPTWRKKHFS